MRWRGRRAIRGLAVTAAVVVAAGVGVVVAPAPALADQGVVETGRARYVVSDTGQPVRVEQVLTLTNTRPPTGAAYYYLNAYGLWLPDGAANLKAMSNGSRLPARVTTVRGEGFAEFSFPTQLRYGQTRTITVTYTIVGAPPRSARPGRVGKGYAAFDVYSPGDAGRATIEIVSPRWMNLDLNIPYTEKLTGDTRVATAKGGGPTGLWSLASLRDPSQVAKRTVSVGANSFSVIGFPGDTAWSTHIAKDLPVILPALEKVAGQPWPSQSTTITEDLSGEVYGWDGSYDKGTIAISEALDPALLAHELSHAYAGYATLHERWLTEGLAQEMATEITAATGKKDAPHPQVSPGGPGAFPLTQWPDGWGVATSAEAYGYPASWRAVHALMTGSAASARPALVRALTTKQTVYDVPGEARTGQHPTTWKQAYDLFEVMGGNRQTSSVMRTWVIGAQDAKLLTARTTARRAYAAQDRLDGPWALPRGVRSAMGDWDFARATQELAQTRELAGPARHAAEAAAQQGLDVTALRTAYQSADEDLEYHEVGAQLATFIRQAGSYGALRADLRAANPLTRLGDAVVSATAGLSDAKAAIEDGDVPAADAALASTSSRLGLAQWVGTGLIGLALVLVLGGVVAMGLVVRRGRRARQPRPAALAWGEPGTHTGVPGRPTSDQDREPAPASLSVDANASPVSTAGSSAPPGTAAPG